MLWRQIVSNQVEYLVRFKLSPNPALISPPPRETLDDIAHWTFLAFSSLHSTSGIHCCVSSNRPHPSADPRSVAALEGANAFEDILAARGPNGFGKSIVASSGAEAVPYAIAYRALATIKKRRQRLTVALNRELNKLVRVSARATKACDHQRL